MAAPFLDFGARSAAPESEFETPSRPSRACAKDGSAGPEAPLLGSEGRGRARLCLRFRSFSRRSALGMLTLWAETKIRQTSVQRVPGIFGSVLRGEGRRRHAEPCPQNCSPTSGNLRPRQGEVPEGTPKKSGLPVPEPARSSAARSGRPFAGRRLGEPSWLKAKISKSSE